MLKLTQDEVVEGIKLYLNNLGINTYSKDVSAVFTPGRKGNPLTVEVNITPKVYPATVFGAVEETQATTITQNIIEQAKAEIQQELALEETSAVTQVSSDGELEVHSSGSVLDEVISGVDQQGTALFN